MLGSLIVSAGASALTNLFVPGLDGAERLVGALIKAAARMAFHVHRIDEDTADEIVSLMKSRVPVDTGTLLNGIEWLRDGDVIQIQASAHHIKGGLRVGSHEGADYAEFVEHGTKAGARGIPIAASEQTLTRDQWFALRGDDQGQHPGRQFRSTTRRLRRSHWFHPGTRPQPFFWNSANDVLGQKVADGYADAFNQAFYDSGFDAGDFADGNALEPPTISADYQWLN